ncbi:MAG: trypsin-like peptidase domain-containing protein [Acidobacteriota bacterium]
MVDVKAVAKPKPSILESVALEGVAAPARDVLPGNTGSRPAGASRASQLLVRGKADPRRHMLETVIGGVDQRQRILETDLTPWRMICSLEMHSPNGGSAVGTGWLVGPRTIITAGHCVFSHMFFGGWADRIVVRPGRNGDEEPFGAVESRRFGATDRWVEAEEADFDIGVIHLDQSIGDELGWFAVATQGPDELVDAQINISGYPADRGRGREQYFHANNVLRVSDRRVFYDVDTAGGQSGAPVWVYADDSPDAEPIVVAIHAYGVGGTPRSFGITANSAPRIIPEVHDLIRGWIEEDRVDEPAGDEPSPPHDKPKPTGNYRS